MIIVPEIEAVFITPPRTGSTALRSALRAAFPETLTIYRHMEADGIPHGYDRWRRFGVVRNPFDRLRSLYRYMADPTYSRPHAGTPAWERQAKRVAAMSFDEWLEDRWVFTNPYDNDGSLRYWPRYTVLHSLPEQRKSQFVYVRPDLGTTIIPFAGLSYHMKERFGVEMKRENASAPKNVHVSRAASMFITKHHEWDLMQ